MRNKKQKIVFSIGLILLLLVCFEIYLWLSVSINANSFEASVDKYLSYFPEVVRNTRIITLIRTFMLLISLSSFIYLFIYLINKSFIKIVSVILLVIVSILLFWSLFTMM